MASEINWPLWLLLLLFFLLLGLSIYYLVREAKKKDFSVGRIAGAVFLLVFLLLISKAGFSLTANMESIAWIEPEAFLEETSSEDGHYTVRFYLHNGGATTSYSVLGRVRDNESGKEKNIFWQNRVEQASYEWTDSQTIIINGVTLDVTKDVYDYRKALSPASVAPTLPE